MTGYMTVLLDEDGDVYRRDFFWDRPPRTDPKGDAVRFIESFEKFGFTSTLSKVTTEDLREVRVHVHSEQGNDRGD